MGETTLRIRTQTELEDLQKLADLLRQVADVTDGAEGGGAASGRPPPTPKSVRAGPAGAGPAGGAAPPAPRVRDERGRFVGAGGPAEGAAPPSPGPVVERERDARGRFVAAGEGVSGSGGGGGGGGWMGRLGKIGSDLGSVWSSGGGGGRSAIGSYAATAAATATGVGLGQGIFGFILSSGQTFLELSKVTQGLTQRFRDLNGEVDVATMGAALGYTIGHAAPMTYALGAATNRGTPLQEMFNRYGGFARYTGLDPTMAMSAFGTMGRLGGMSLSDMELAEILGGARAQNMDTGRLEEFVRTTEGLVRQSFQASGDASLQHVLQLQRGIFAAMENAGVGEMGRGEMGAQTLAGLQATMTSGGPMQTYLMRSMGYGREGGPGYIEMRKRLEAGIYGAEGAENLKSLFEDLEGRGLGRGGMFRALESVAGGRLTAVQIEALVNQLGTEEGRRAFSGVQRREDTRGAMGSLGEDRALFGGEDGWYRAGKTKISRGEARDLQREDLMMRFGDSVSAGMMKATTGFENLFDAFEKFMGMNPGDLLLRFADAFEKGTERIEAAVGRLPTAHDMARDVQRGATAVGNVMTTGTMDGGRPMYNPPVMQGGHE